MGSRSPRTEAPVAVQVKRQALKEPSDIAEPVAATLEHLQFVVEPFDEPARLVVRKVVRNKILPGIQQRQETLEAGQPTPLHALPPEPHPPQAVGFRAGRAEDRGQLLTERVGGLERRAILEERGEAGLLGLRQILGPLAERPERVLHVFPFRVRQFLPQPAYFLLAERVHAIAIVACDVKAVNHDGGLREHFLHGRDVALPHVATDGRDGLLSVDRHGQPRHDGGLQAVG